MKKITAVIIGLALLTFTGMAFALDDENDIAKNHRKWLGKVMVGQYAEGCVPRPTQPIGIIEVNPDKHLDRLYDDAGKIVPKGIIITPDGQEIGWIKQGDVPGPKDNVPKGTITTPDGRELGWIKQGSELDAKDTVIKYLYDTTDLKLTLPEEALVYNYNIDGSLKGTLTTPDGKELEWIKQGGDGDVPGPKENVPKGTIITPDGKELGWIKQGGNVVTMPMENADAPIVVSPPKWNGTFPSELVSNVVQACPETLQKVAMISQLIDSRQAPSATISYTSEIKVERAELDIQK